MTSTNTFDETEVAVLLIGSREDQTAGLRSLDREYRTRVFAHLRACFPGLQPTDLSECYFEALGDLATQVVAYGESPSQSNFDPNKPLLPYLKAIAWRRAADRCRRHETREKVLHAVGLALRDTKLNAAWTSRHPLERQEFWSAVYQAVAILPPKQRIVWAVYIDHFHECSEPPGNEHLRQLVSRETGEEWTLAAVKGALRNGKQPVAEYLKKKGWVAP